MKYSEGSRLFREMLEKGESFDYAFYSGDNRAEFKFFDVRFRFEKTEDLGDVILPVDQYGNPTIIANKDVRILKYEKVGTDEYVIKEFKVLWDI